jgi:hypothetical protein
MPLLTSTLFGLVTAILFAVAWIVMKLVLPLTVPYLLSRFSNDGVGGGSAFITSGSILMAALIGFVCGFLWRFRRLSRQA